MDSDIALPRRLAQQFTIGLALAITWFAVQAQKLPPRAEMSTIVVAQASTERETEPRLRAAIKYLTSGKPDYSDMEPMLRVAVEQQLPAIGPRLRALGALRKLEYIGAQQGADVYKATFENGLTSWAIQLGPTGKIATLFFN